MIFFSSIALPVILLCSLSTTYAQTDLYLTIEKEPIKNFAIQDSITKIEAINNDSLVNVWLASHWDTTNYNPYKNELITYPFSIAFADSMYTSPIDRPKVVTSRYGWRNRRAHKGIDIDLITGDDVKAMFDGKVRYVGYHYGHGKTVVVRHYNGLETSYAHLSKYQVNVNDTVSKNQVIGKGGTTGNARGSHLHLEVSFKGIYIHPEYLFDFGEKNSIRSDQIWVTKDWVTPYIHNSKRKSAISVNTTYEQALESEKRKKKLYVVKSGDTLSEISKKYRVPIMILCRTNAISKTSTLRIGQKLVLTP